MMLKKDYYRLNKVKKVNNNYKKSQNQLKKLENNQKNKYNHINKHNKQIHL